MQYQRRTEEAEAHDLAPSASGERTIAAASTNARVVEDFFRALERQDIDCAIAAMTEDATYRNNSLPAARGHREIRRHLELIVAPLDSYSVEDLELREIGDQVFVKRHDVLRAGSFRARHFVESRFELRGGRISSWIDRYRYGPVIAALVRSLPGILRDLLRPANRG